MGAGDRRRWSRLASEASLRRIGRDGRLSIGFTGMRARRIARHGPTLGAVAQELYASRSGWQDSRGRGGGMFAARGAYMTSRSTGAERNLAWTAAVGRLAVRFIVGAGSVVNIFGVRRIRRVADDAEALASDWRAVGADLRRVTGRMAG